MKCATLIKTPVHEHVFLYQPLLPLPPHAKIHLAGLLHEADVIKEAKAKIPCVCSAINGVPYPTNSYTIFQLGPKDNSSFLSRSTPANPRKRFFT